MYLLIAKTDKTLAKKQVRKLLIKLRVFIITRKIIRYMYHQEEMIIWDHRQKNQAETLALHYHYFDRHNLSYHQWQGRHHGFRQSYPYLYYGIRSFYWCACFHE